MGVYVDNFIFGSKNVNTLEWLKDQLMKEFSMKDLGKTKTIIGWEILQDFSAGILKIDEKRYIRDFLESKKMASCHLTVLSVKAGFTFFLD